MAEFSPKAKEYLIKAVDAYIANVQHHIDFFYKYSANSSNGLSELKNDICALEEIKKELVKDS